MAMEPPLLRVRYLHDKPDDQHLLWIDLFNGNLELLHTVCELRCKGFVDLRFRQSPRMVRKHLNVTSYTSISSFVSPTCGKILLMAMIGEIPMYLGSTPALCI